VSNDVESEWDVAEQAERSNQVHEPLEWHTVTNEQKPQRRAVRLTRVPSHWRKRGRTRKRHYDLLAALDQVLDFASDELAHRHNQSCRAKHHPLSQPADEAGWQVHCAPSDLMNNDDWRLAE